jgi:hypothetical protein
MYHKPQEARLFMIEKSMKNESWTTPIQNWSAEKREELSRRISKEIEIDYRI